MHFSFDNTAKLISSDRSGDQNYNSYEWIVFMNEPPDKLDLVDRVEYRLHETFANPIRVMTDRASRFALKSSGWGEFTLRIAVELKDGGVVRTTYPLDLSKAVAGDTVEVREQAQGDRQVLSRQAEFAWAPSDLMNVAVLAQALDNQWVRTELLDKMLSTGQSLLEVQRDRERQVLAEYRRALVNAPQVVINRAYLYNNPVVFGDYLEPGSGRDAFKELLRAGAIVPYLFDERSPTEEPRFTIDPRGSAGWEAVCGEVRPHAVRLSWDDDENKALIQDQLARRFHAAADGLINGDLEAFCRDLGLPLDAGPALLARLDQIRDLCSAARHKGVYVSRNDLYKEFVVIDGTRPEEGRYDKSKPFAREIKQLVDLSYNINLPDALDRFALTPIDSPARTVLQELGTARRAADEVAPEQLLRIVRRHAFALAQEGLFVKSMDQLDLQDIVKVRQTDEWAQYIKSLQGLVDRPQDLLGAPDAFEAAASAVYTDYIAVARVMTKLVSAERRKAPEAALAKWQPAINIIIAAGGAIIETAFAANGDPTYKITGKIAASAIGQTVPVVARLVVRGITGVREQAELGTSIDFIRGRMKDARRQWAQMVDEIRGFGFADLPSAVPQEQANMNYPQAVAP